MVFLSVALLAWAVGAQAGVSVRPASSEHQIMYDSARAVFFNPGSAVIRHQSMPAVQLSVSIAKVAGATGELLTGYCDRDELRAGKCPALGLQRAEAVKAALVQLGMKGDTIEVTTSSDVFDPVDDLNRRVTVVPKVKSDP
jgi:outer membrane protein OmpA-like peptidoglycan-associated protein